VLRRAGSDLVGRGLAGAGVTEPTDSASPHALERVPRTPDLGDDSILHRTERLSNAALMRVILLQVILPVSSRIDSIEHKTSAALIQ
jgi:hypothetical protein